MRPAISLNIKISRRQAFASIKNTGTRLFDPDSLLPAAAGSPREKQNSAFKPRLSVFDYLVHQSVIDGFLR